MLAKIGTIGIHIHCWWESKTTLENTLEVLFTIAKLCKQHKCPPTHE